MKKFDRVEVLSYISDLYKDVNGIRPRFYDFNDSFMIFMMFMNDFMIQMILFMICKMFYDLFKLV